MRTIYSMFLLWSGLPLIASAQGSTPITGYDISQDSYQNNSLLAQNSIELLPGFSVDAPGFTATLLKPYTVAGQWQGVMNWPLVAIHTSVLPTGKVVTWQGHNADNMMETNIYEWDPADPTREPSSIRVERNIFCSGHTLLADGRLFIAGGHDGSHTVDNGGIMSTYTGGIDQTSIYTGASANNNYTPSIIQQMNMHRRRWYPTTTTLSDGSVLTISGETEPSSILGENRYRPELWRNGSWSWLSTADRDRKLPLYPMMFLAPDGRVFNAGPSVRTGYLNTANGGSWTDGPLHMLGRAYVPAATDALTAYTYTDHDAGTAVMYAPGKILVLGGMGAAGITNTVERIDLNAGAAAQFEYDAPMRFARFHVNSTVLPDGTVLVTGGIPDESRIDASAIFPAEIWTPPASGSGPGTWATMNSMSEPRLYHSTAVLLPDGRVLSAGGGHGGQYTDHRTAEIFSPPYLFRGPQPVITSAPTSVSYGAAFVFDTPSPNSIDAVSWIRLSSVTHSFNMNQRFLKLPITSRSTTSVTVTAPTDANICPPGDYMVFALSNGVPSKAKIVSISDNPCAASINLITRSYPNPSDCLLSAEARVSGTNLGSNYRWFIDGVYMPSKDGATAVEVPLNTCRRRVTFTVEVTPRCGGSPVSYTDSVENSSSGENCSCE